MAGCALVRVSFIKKKRKKLFFITMSVCYIRANYHLFSWDLARLFIIANSSLYPRLIYQSCTVYISTVIFTCMYKPIHQHSTHSQHKLHSSLYHNPINLHQHIQQPDWPTAIITSKLIQKQTKAFAAR